MSKGTSYLNLNQCILESLSGLLVPASTKDYQPTAGIPFFQHHASEFVEQTMRKSSAERERAVQGTEAAGLIWR